MKYTIRQRFFSWFDSFDIYDERGNTAFTVKGQLSWGHCLHFFDHNGQDRAVVKEVVLTLLPQFEFYIDGVYRGRLQRELSLFKPRYTIDFFNWQVTGDFMRWDYQIMNQDGERIASIEKDLFHMTDHYVIDVKYEDDALPVLMLAVAIDAEKCTASKAS